MASSNDNSNIVSSHLSLFAGFCRPKTDTPHPSHMLDSSPRDPRRDGNINAMSQAEFDALPAWSDIEDDPDDSHRRQRARDTSPRYSACMESASCFTPLLPSVIAVETDEEEEDSRCGFWGESAGYDSLLTSFPTFRGRTPVTRERKDKGRRRTWEPLCFCVALCVSMLVTTGVAFAMDLGASQYGYGTGVAQYMVQGKVDKSVSVHAATGREIQFCLTTPDRSAPGAQTWRFISPIASIECGTQVLKLHAEPEEAWKLHTSDELKMGNAMSTRMAKRHAALGEQKFVTVADRIHALEYGDNLAAEGVLGQRIHRDWEKRGE